MIRNLKALGLALVAVFAMSALAASAASAQQGTLTGEESPFTLTGTDRPEGENYLGAFGLKTTCPKSHYAGHRPRTFHETFETGLEHEFLKNNDTVATIEPIYTNCTTAGFPTTVDMNECDYDLELGVTNPELGEDVYDVATTINCPSETSTPVVTVFTEYDEETNKHTKLFCEVEVTVDQSKDYEGLHVKDNTDGTLNLTGEIKNLTAHRTPGEDTSIFCFSKKTDEAAKLVADVVIDAHNELLETIGVGIHDE